MIRNYIKIAWRTLSKNKVQSLINITGLAVGMAAAVLIFLWVQNELSYDAYHPNADKIFRLTNTWNVNGNFSKSDYSSMPLAGAAVAQIPEVEQMAIISHKAQVLNINNQLFTQKHCAYVSNNWFTFFKYKFIAGNAASFNNGLFNILLTQSAAKTYFGNEDAMGKIIRIDTVNYQVKAIVEDNPANSSFRFEVFMPMTAFLSNKANADEAQRWGAGMLMTFVELKTGTDPVKIEDELDAIQKRNFKFGSSKHVLVPLAAMHFEKGLDYSMIEHDTDSKVGLFILMAVLLLFTACINYVNLTTAMAGVRLKEVGIKKIIGAHRIHLFKQFVTETLLISFIALVFALVIIQLSLPFFNSFTGRNFALSFTSPVLLLTLLATLLTTLILSSIYPALLLSSFKPMDLFNGKNVLKIKDDFFRKGLVVVQFSISVILIASTIIIYKQQQFIRQNDAQYNRAQVFNITLPTNKFSDLKTQKLKDAALINWYQNLKHEFEKERSISSVSFTDGDMIKLEQTFEDDGIFNYDGYVKENARKLDVLNTDADFEHIFNPQLVVGRWLKDNSSLSSNFTDDHEFVVNQTAVKILHIAAPVLGKRFEVNNVKGHIVGIVKDFHYHSLHEKIGALAISNRPDWFPYINIKVNPQNVPAAIAAAQKIWSKYVPEQPLEYTFMNEAFDRLYRSDNKKAGLINLFTGIIIFVSGMGIFGMAIHASERRTKEIGIRKVLGATVTNITTMLTKDFVYLVLIAVAVATPVAYLLMNKWLQDFAYRIQISWWMLAFAGLTAVAIAVVSVSFQTIKAAIANPVNSLRNE